jgi:5'-3' exonuclease
MGIPSYYKKLIDTIPNLISKRHPNGDIDWLFMDFNCLIYHCLHREDTPIYSGDIIWESQLLECVVKYCLKVVHEVNPKKGVFIAIDGVVPMAKMRQQRLRRFKSVWLSQEGENKMKWDTNAITPGTDFMKKLKLQLQTMIQKYKKYDWILSSSDEFGEGEHKIIGQWRSGKYSGNFAIYGLDADLIILSLLGREMSALDNSVYLFREEMNAGKMVYDEEGEEVFEWFSINSLRNYLIQGFDSFENQRLFILNYCFIMSILGNDFLPSSLGLKIRDDGHSELFEIIKKLSFQEISFIHPQTFSISHDSLLEFFKVLSKDEDTRIKKYISKKKMMAKNIVGNLELPIGDNNWPLSRIEEEILLSHEKELHVNWREKYMTLFSGFTYTSNEINKICKEYLYGIQWIWAYYTGNQKVCYNWCYPFSLPPLWDWIYNYLLNYGLPNYPDNILVEASDIKTVEQLALVLPLESWYLIPSCPEKSLPKYAPQYYPSHFGFESIGKRYFWECECLIPVPSILEIKNIIKIFS